jgi:maltose O-acetyltransferase
VSTERTPVTEAPAGSRVARALRHRVGGARWQLVARRQGGVRLAGRASLGARADVTVAGDGVLELGDHVVVADDFHCYVQGRCTIGDRTFINRWSYLSAFLEVTIGPDVLLGERVSIHDENHDVMRGGSAYLASPVRIGAGTWIGAGVTVLPGAQIGEGCVIAAGAVVRGEIPPRSLAAGVPARVVRRLDAVGRP